MPKKVGIGFTVALIAFAIYVAMQPGQFMYIRGDLIKAPPERIFPYLSHFKLGNEWSPYAKIDPKMKVTFSGPETGQGARMDFEGNSDVGTGSLELLRMTANSEVEIQLTMLKPFKGINIVRYQLAPEGNSTRFTWSMAGELGFVGKLVGIFIDCEKKIGEQFEKGIQNLKEITERTLTVSK